MIERPLNPQNRSEERSTYVHTETQTRYQSRLVKHNKGDNTLDNDQNEYNLLKKN